jgi:transposase IS200 family protein
MTNHVHLLLTPAAQDSISRMMQYIGRRYVPYINHTYGRSGTLWEGRYKSSLIQEEPYLLACMRYIELNPVRANMVKNGAEYPWSSYHFNALGKEDDLLTMHAFFESLGPPISQSVSISQRNPADNRWIFRHPLLVVEPVVVVGARSESVGKWWATGRLSRIYPHGFSSGRFVGRVHTSIGCHSIHFS